jgi:hypothetical protein
MDKIEWVRNRRGRYMGQILTEFEEKIEPRIPQDVAEDFKVFVRRKVGALAADCTDIMKLEPDTEINAHAQAVRDGVFPDGSPSRTEERR